MARKIQTMIDRLSTRDFKWIVENNLLPNCPITKQDIVDAEKIFGPDIGSLKGKTVRQKPTVINTPVTDLPPTVMDHYRDVILASGIMFVNKIPFFITISQHIKFGTVKLLPNQKATTLFNAMQQANTVYQKRGFCIQHLFMDGQFEPMRGAFLEMKIILNTVSTDEHVPKIERYICTTKERTCCVYNTPPFNKIPGQLVAEMVFFRNFWLNSFPHPDGIWDTISPRTIMTGIKLDLVKHYKLEFGSYFQTHEAHDNSMTTGTIDAIALCPTGNVQGG